MKEFLKYMDIVQSAKQNFFPLKFYWLFFGDNLIFQKYLLVCTVHTIFSTFTVHKYINMNSFIIEAYMEFTM